MRAESRTEDQEVAIVRKEIAEELENLFAINRLNEFRTEVRFEGWGYMYPDIILEAKAEKVKFSKCVAGVYIAVNGDLFLLRTMMEELVYDARTWVEASSPNTPLWRLDQLVERESGRYGLAINPNIGDDFIVRLSESNDAELIKLLYANEFIDRKQKMIIEIQTGVSRA